MSIYVILIHNFHIRFKLWNNIQASLLHENGTCAIANVIWLADWLFSDEVDSRFDENIREKYTVCVLFKTKKKKIDLQVLNKICI